MTCESRRSRVAVVLSCSTDRLAADTPPATAGFASCAEAAFRATARVGTTRRTCSDWSIAATPGAETPDASRRSRYALMDAVRFRTLG